LATSLDLQIEDPAGDPGGESSGLAGRARIKDRLRLICATNVDIERASGRPVPRGLYYRINVVPVSCRQCASGGGHPVLTQFFIAR